MKHFLGLIAMALMLTACNNSGKGESVGDSLTVDPTTAQPITTEPDTVGSMGDTASHNARNSLDVAGTYKGVLPCASCPGIETTITLHQNNTYTIVSKYLDEKGKAEFTEEGAWRWKDGSHIVLQDRKEASPYYFVAENGLVQLDLEGNKVESSLKEHYVLNKIK